MAEDDREVIYTGIKLLWTAIAIFLIAPVIAVPAAGVVAAVLAIIGAILMWMDK